jgi:hypothetical protein
MRSLFFYFFGLGVVSACTAVEGERILARDLVREVPPLAGIEPETDLGPSPLPGVRRVLSRAQLLRFMSTHESVPAGLPDSVCVERPLVQLEPEAVENALRKSARELFPGQVVQLELLDYSRYQVSPGTLRFQRQGVLGGSGNTVDAALLWRGSLRTEIGRSIPIWARAKVLVQRACWRAKVSVVAGARPAEDQFEREDRWVNPFLMAADCVNPSQKEVRLRRTVRQGQFLIRSDLTALPPVRRGDKVQATLNVASAKLSVDAVAEMDGLPGQSVFVKREGRRLRARVVSAGSVEIMPRDSQ